MCADADNFHVWLGWIFPAGKDSNVPPSVDLGECPPYLGERVRYGSHWAIKSPPCETPVLERARHGGQGVLFIGLKRLLVSLN